MEFDLKSNYVSCNILGPGEANSGLGNQLFCLATTIAYALENKKTASFPQILKNNHYSKYNKIFYYNLLKDPINSFKYFYKEPNFSYTDIPFFDGNVKLEGYFQSERYFKKYRQEILDIFNIKNIQEVFKKKYEIQDGACSLHVRRGDYLNLSHYHSSLTINYYKQCINLLGKEREYLIFSDDIEWCKKEFNFLKNVSFSEGRQDWQDIILMSLCSDNIIANSSFSWWGAWFNQNTKNTKIAPKKWFAKNIKNDIIDLIPNEWSRV